MAAVAVAADALGNVYVAWHGLGARNRKKAEGNRKVWVSMSHDDGKTFAPEKPAWDEPTGRAPAAVAAFAVSPTARVMSI